MPYFTNPDGQRLHYQICGEGPLVLVLPGNTAASPHHSGDLQRLATEFSCQAAALDFAGTGQSDRMAAWPTDWWARGACDAAALVTALGAAPALVLGISGGGVVALHMARHFPAQVRAVVADSCVHQWDPAALRAEIAQRDAQTPDQIGFWAHGHGADWAAVVAADSALLRAFADAGGEWLRPADLAAITCPVLLTGSLHDDAIPDIAAKNAVMAQHIPDCRLYLHATGGHPLLWSAPDAFYAQFGLFLADVNSR